MKFGVCAKTDAAPTLKEAGYDYVEVGVQAVFQGTLSDDQFPGLGELEASPLPAPAANMLVPGDLKIVGPDADLEALTVYMKHVVERAGKAGTNVLVFGSGAARNVPDDVDRTKARDQVTAFLHAAAPLAQQAGVTIVIEPLNRDECNILNSVGESMEYVRDVNHPGLQCLVDSYHFWLEDEPLSNLEDAMASIKHVHVADKEGRVAPGESGKSDYVPFFKVLKEGGYDRLISIEGRVALDDVEALKRHKAYLDEAWAKA